MCAFFLVAHAGLSKSWRGKQEYPPFIKAFMNKEQSFCELISDQRTQVVFYIIIFCFADFAVKISEKPTEKAPTGECYFQHHIFSDTCEGSYRTLRVVPTATCIEIPRIDDYSSAKFFIEGASILELAICHNLFSELRHCKQNHIRSVFAYYISNCYRY